MKRILIFALFVLGMYNASAFAMAQEILLTEVYSMLPFDDPGDKVNIGRPDPNQIIASIDGYEFSISTGTDAPAYAEVIDSETGEIVAEEEFEGETTMSIPEEGDYELYIYTESGSVMAGEFSVE